MAGKEVLQPAPVNSLRLRLNQEYLWLIDSGGPKCPGFTFSLIRIFENTTNDDKYSVGGGLFCFFYTRRMHRWKDEDF